MWLVHDKIAPDSLVPSADDLSLASLLRSRDGLTLRHRQLAGILSAASMFHLNNSPWIEQQLEPEFIYVPHPSIMRIQQWCPHVHCSLSQHDKRARQTDDIAALGILILELEVGRIADWSRLGFRILNSIEDR
jgi:hypothetical protein